MMKKILAITLTAVLTFTVLISGASGYSDCAVRCMREMAKDHPNAATGTTSLRLPDCCSGGLQSPCEMNMAPEVKIPECSITSHPTASYHSTALGMMSGIIVADYCRNMQVGLNDVPGNSYKDSPIYLRNLSLLC